VKHACERISQLASDQLERKLSIAERASMWFHFLMCGACRHYHENLNKLHQALQLKRAQQSQGQSIPADKREVIEQALQTLNHSKK